MSMEATMNHPRCSHCHDTRILRSEVDDRYDAQCGYCVESAPIAPIEPVTGAAPSAASTTGYEGSELYD